MLTWVFPPQVEDLVHALEGQCSLYGIQAESVHSLIVSFLQPFFEEDRKEEEKEGARKGNEGEGGGRRRVGEGGEVIEVGECLSAHEDDTKKLAIIIKLLQHFLKSPGCVFPERKVKRMFVGLRIQQVSTFDMFNHTIAYCCLFRSATKK